MHYQRDHAFEDASRVSGVLRIDNWINVAAAVPPADIRQRIEKAFERQADLEAEKIAVKTEAGKVTLIGHVSSWEKRNLAERAAWAAPGVTKVEDKLVVG